MHSGHVQLSVWLQSRRGEPLTAAVLEEAQVALLDAKVQVEERTALARYRAFAARVARAAGLHVEQQAHDLTGYQLDTVMRKVQAMQEEKVMDAKEMATVAAPSAYDTARRAVAEGMKRGAVAGLVTLVQPPAVRLVSKAFGQEAATRAERWLQTPTGEAAFSVLVGGVGLGAQALGLTGKFTAKMNAICGEAVAQGIQGGAKTVLVGALGELFAAYTQAAAQIDAVDAVG